MEALPVGVAIVDTKGGIIQANHAYEQVWGSPRSPVHSVSDYTRYKARWVETGQPVQPGEWASARALQTGETVVGQLMRIERFDGTNMFVYNSAAPVFGTHARVVGSAVAILDYYQAVRG